MLNAVKERIEDAVGADFKRRFEAWWHGTDMSAGSDDDELENVPSPPKNPGLDPALIKVKRHHLVSVSELIFGDGYISPGGNEYFEEWAQQLSLSKEKSVAFIGVGLGGPALEMAKSGDCWITGYQRHSDLAEAAVDKMVMAGMAKKVVINHYQPEDIDLPEEKFNSVASKDEFCSIENKDHMLGEIKKSLKANGILMFTDYVRTNDDVSDEKIAACFANEDGQAYLWTDDHYVEAFKTLKLEMRVHEDVSPRYIEMITSAWAGYQNLVDHIKSSDTKALEKACLLKAVAECAEMWTHRAEALVNGDLKVCRFLVLKK